MDTPHDLEHYTREQRLLMEIREKLCGGNASRLARAIGRDATYVNRLFYPEGKAGRRGIGLEIMNAAIKAFGLPPGFWHMEPPAITEEFARDFAHSMAMKGEDAHRVPRWFYSDWNPPVISPKLGEAPRSYGMAPILAWDHPNDLPDGDFVMVPRLDVKLSAGSGQEQVEIDLVKDNPQAFRTEWIRLMRLKPAKLAAMRASGESMEPTIHAGDSLLVDTGDVNVVDGKVYALWYEGGERVKRLYRLPGGGLRIKSDNPAFESIDLPAEYAGHVRIIGRVVHRSGTGGL